MKKMLLMSALTLGTLATTTVSVNAAATDPTPTTEANIGLIEATGPTDPTDPISPVDPTDPTDPDGGGETGQPGPLSLDYVSGFNFGTANEIKPTAQSYDAIPSAPSKALGFQVTDTRGSGAGWDLSVSLSAFVGGNEATHTLKNATLTFPTATADLTTGNADRSNAPVGIDAIIASDGTDTPIMSAGNGQGMGTWFTSLKPSETKLKVEAGAYVDTYKADLTWTLTATPTQP